MNEPALKINEQYEISLILPDQVPLVGISVKEY